MKPENKLIREIGKRIRRLREDKGWSQEQLAIEADVDNSHLSKLERGEGNPTVKLVYRIAAALDVEVSDVLGEYTVGGGKNKGEAES
jgi:transcriptional regulator with XRE-family HTH domain